MLQYYEQLQELNRAFGNQLARRMSERDANLNAINSLFSLAAVVAIALEENLESLRRDLLPNENQ